MAEQSFEHYQKVYTAAIVMSKQEKMAAFAPVTGTGKSFFKSELAGDQIGKINPWFGFGEYIYAIFMEKLICHEKSAIFFYVNFLDPKSAYSAATHYLNRIRNMAHRQVKRCILCIISLGEVIVREIFSTLKYMPVLTDYFPNLERLQNDITPSNGQCNNEELHFRKTSRCVAKYTYLNVPSIYEPPKGLKEFLRFDCKDASSKIFSSEDFEEVENNSDLESSKKGTNCCADTGSGSGKCAV